MADILKALEQQQQAGYDEGVKAERKRWVARANAAHANGYHCGVARERSRVALLCSLRGLDEPVPSDVLLDAIRDGLTVEELEAKLSGGGDDD